MYNIDNVYTLCGKEQRSVIKIITEKRIGEDFPYEEHTRETVCYFTYLSDDIDGIGTLKLYIDNSVMSYEELHCGRAYKLSFSNSYINFIMSVNDYNEDLYKELESRENIDK